MDHIVTAIGSQEVLTSSVRSADQGGAVAAPLNPPAPRERNFRILGALVVVLALVTLPAVGLVWLRHNLETAPPVVLPPDLASIFFDTTRVSVVFTVEGEQVMWPTTADDI